VAGISNLLAQSNINISFMTVCRTARNEDAIMAIGIDEEPSAEVRLWAGTWGVWGGSLRAAAVRCSCSCSCVDPALPCCQPPASPTPPAAALCPQTLDAISGIKGVAEYTFFRELKF
jgi:hypothetical protein